MFGFEVHHQTNLMSALTAISLDRRPMSAQQLVGGDGRLEQVAVAGRQRPVQVAAVRDHPRLIQRRPQLDPVVERSEEHTSELQSLAYLVCRLLLEKKKTSSSIQPRVARGF